MELVKFNAQPRVLSSKGALNTLRRSGRIPAVCYANKKEAIHLSVDALSFKNQWDAPEKRNTLFTLEVEGGKPINAIVYEVQRDLLSKEVTHIDFMLIDKKESVNVDVPLKLVGTSLGVKNDGGTLAWRARKIRVSCLPSDIPVLYEFDVTNVPAGSNVYLSDVDIKGATLVSSPRTVLLAISKGRPGN